MSIFQSGTFSVVAAGDGLGSVNVAVSGNTVELSLTQAQSLAYAIASCFSTGVVDTSYTGTNGNIFIQGTFSQGLKSFTFDGVALVTPGVNIVLLISGTPYITFLTTDQAAQLSNALGRYVVTYK